MFLGRRIASSTSGSTHCLQANESLTKKHWKGKKNRREIEKENRIKSYSILFYLQETTVWEGRHRKH